MKKVYDKQTLWSKILNHSFIFSSSRKISNSVEEAKKFIEKNSLKSVKTKKIDKYLKREENEDYMIYSYNGTLNNNTGKIIIYVHGGSFLENINKYQIKFAKEIAKKTGSTLIVPIYELLPKGNAEKLIASLIDIYIKVLGINPREINLLGDSAGGGVILSLSMIIRDKELRTPDRIVMLSPWLDLSMSNPDIIEDAKKDYMNGLEGTKYAGELWARGMDIKSPIVSPMYGDFSDVGKISIIYGGCEILTSECKRFTDLLDRQNIDYNAIIYQCEGHDFAIFPTKEGKMAVKDIIQLMGEDLNERNHRTENKREN